MDKQVRNKNFVFLKKLSFFLNSLFLVAGSMLFITCASSSLRDAVENNDIPGMEKFITQGEKIDQIYDQKKEGKTSLLHIAAREGNIEAADYLISKGANVNLELQKNNLDEDTTPLICAIQANKFEMVKFLIEKGADIEHFSNTLHIAIKYRYRNDFRIIDYLLLKGAKINRWISSNWPSPLYTAVFEKNVSMVKYLLDKGADPNYGDPLIQCMYPAYFNETIAFLLIDKGADFYKADSSHMTPFFRAKAQENEKLIKRMQQSGTGIHPIFTAIDDKDQAAVAKIIATDKTWKTSRNMFRQTPLQAALAHSSPDIIKLFVKNGEKIETAADDMIDNFKEHFSNFYGELNKHISHFQEEGLAVNALINASIYDRAAGDNILLTLTKTIIEQAKTFSDNDSNYWGNYDHQAFIIGIIYKIVSSTPVKLTDGEKVELINYYEYISKRASRDIQEHNYKMSTGYYQSNSQYVEYLKSIEKLRGELADLINIM